MDRGNPSARSGLVNFPTWDPRFKHTGEGGMFVRLVVLPNRDADFMVCSGGEIRFFADGVLVGDDLTAFPSKPDRPDGVRRGVSGGAVWLGLVGGRGRDHLGWALGVCHQPGGE